LPEAPVFDPAPWVLLVLLAALLAEPVPVSFEALPLALLAEFVLVFDASLLCDPVPVAEPLPLLFEPVPDFEPPFFDFEPVFEFMSGPNCGPLPPP